MPTAYIGLGANVASPVGQPPATLAAAVLRLNDFGRVTARSSLYRTDPVGFADQPRFVNAVVAFETALAPQALIKKLLEIEKEFGRDRSHGILNGPRTLDLDILLIDELETSEPGLELPHPRLAERAFVLIPLREIAPRLQIRGQSVAALVEALRLRGDEPDAVVRIESDHWPPPGEP